MILSEQTNATILNTLHGVRHSLLSSFSSTCSWVAPLVSPQRLSGLFFVSFLLGWALFAPVLFCVSNSFCVSCLVLLHALPTLCTHFTSCLTQVLRTLLFNCFVCAVLLLFACVVCPPLLWFLSLSSLPPLPREWSYLCSGPACTPVRWCLPLGIWLQL